MAKLRVGVLRGGPSSEHDVSLKTGAAVLAHLPDIYIPIDIFIDRDGQWHSRGIPRDPYRILSSVDVVVNALHGQYGEDGVVQRLLERYAVPYTGSSSVPSALAMNKALAKERLKELGILMPPGRVLSVSEHLDQELIDTFRSLPQPLVVKPTSAGSSVGVSIARGFDKLKEAVQNAFGFGNQVLVETYIKGREGTGGVIDRFRGESIYSLPPVEIIPDSTRSFFDYDAKYDGSTREVCPSNFSAQEKRAIQDAARAVHETLGLRHYSRSDFIVTPEGVFFLEANTLPGLTEESLYPKSVEAIGASLPHFLDHIVQLAVGRK